MAHIRQSRPDYGLGFQVKVLQTFKLLPFYSETLCASRGAPGMSQLLNIRQVPLNADERRRSNPKSLCFSILGDI